MGGLFIAIVLAFPRGLAGLMTDQILPWIERLRGARPTHPGAAPGATPSPAPAE
jgi:urea transport system permease protein